MNKRTKKFILSLLWLLIFPVTLVLTTLASANHEIVESFYSEKVYKFVSFIIPFQYIPYFSFSEVLFVLIIVLVIIWLIIFIVRLVRNREDRKWRILIVIRNTLIICAVFYFLFYFLWGFNYYRATYSEIAELPLQESSTEELKELCSALITKTNDARALLPSADDDTLDKPMSRADLQNISKGAYAKAMDDSIPGIITSSSNPKPLISSAFFSYAGISGIYNPFTVESNYNDDVPMPLKGASICHELAHRQGFAREDEANFISYLICTNSDDKYLNYSGFLLATIHSMNRLYEIDKNSFNELRGLYNKDVNADLAKHNEFWRAHEGIVEEISSSINDSYLKNNNQTDGVASYNRMVDLLLAQHNIEGI